MTQNNLNPVCNSFLDALQGGSLSIVDLTASLSSRTPTLELPPPFVNLIDFSLDYQSEYDDRGPYWKHANIHTGEHIGTHIDAPVHWVSGKQGKDVASIAPERLVGPAVVLDFRTEVENDPDFLLQPDHIKQWEADNGPLPDNCWILYRTGWDAFSDDQDRFLNKDDEGSHTPGFSSDCATWLASRSEVSGVGVETVGIDAGRGFELDPPMPMHHKLLGNDKYGLTSLKNLDKLPTRGAIIMVAPLPIVGGTGSPSRVFAFV